MAAAIAPVARAGAGAAGETPLCGQGLGEEQRGDKICNGAFAGCARLTRAVWPDVLATEVGRRVPLGPGKGPKGRAGSGEAERSREEK